MRTLLFLSSCLLMTWSGFSQTNTATDSIPTYLRTAVIPDFTTYKAPDSTVFTKEDMQKGEAALLMIFSPDCGHCQNVTTELIKNIDHFKKTQIVMVTWLPFNDMTSFYTTYKIADYPQITMAWDPKYFFLPYYHVQMYPKLIVNNKKGKYVKEFQGNIQIEDVWKAIGNK